jgi:predicted dehydrogenase
MPDVTSVPRTPVAFVGCGYVADYYALTLKNHPELELIGVYDKKPDRLNAFSETFGAYAYPSLEELMSDDAVAIIVNLTDPQSHCEVTKVALLHDKHVYTEKPISIEFLKSRELASLAASRGLYLSSAPCTVLSEAAQTVWKALRKDLIGTVRLVYAEMDDGLIHQMKVDQWSNVSGASWPYHNELVTGCTFEHAGYWLSWLLAMFGPAVEVSSFATNIVDEPISGVSASELAPDFSVACLRFASGVTARLTCSIVASRERELRVFGDRAEMTVSDAWDFGARVQYRKRPEADFDGKGFMPFPLLRQPAEKLPDMPNNIDFCRGISELAEAILEKRPCRLSADFGVHIDEICEMISSRGNMGSALVPTTTFEAMEPMDWAQ